MRWTDLFDIDKILKATVKCFFGVLALILTFQLLIIALSRASDAELAGVLVGLGLLSFVAYFVRERRLAKASRHRSTRGVERTPLLPRNEEDK